MTEDSDQIMNDLRHLKPHLKNWGITRLRVFGSVLHGDAGTDSDVDLIVDFEKKPDLLTFIGIKQDMEDRLRRKVDLFTEQGIDRYLKDRILAEAGDV